MERVLKKRRQLRLSGREETGRRVGEVEEWWRRWKSGGGGRETSERFRRVVEETGRVVGKVRRVGREK